MKKNVSKIKRIVIYFVLILAVTLNSNVLIQAADTEEKEVVAENVTIEQKIEPIKIKTLDVSMPQTKSQDDGQSHYLFPSTVTGVEWDPVWAPTTESWRGYFQVPYDGYEGGSNSYLTVNGSFSHFSSISTNNSYYSIDVVSVTSSQIKLYVLANPDNSTTKATPQDRLTLTFKDTFGEIVGFSIPVIPSFNYNNQTYGQCTWYAGYIMRNYNNLSNQGYGGTYISGNTSSSGFPKAKSVISLKKSNGSWAHHVFLDSISSSTSGSTTTLTLHCKDTNWSSNNGSVSSFNAVMKYNTATGSITQMPVIRGSSYSIYIKH